MLNKLKKIFFILFFLCLIIKTLEAESELSYFMDYSIAGGGVGTDSNTFYTDLDIKGGIHVTKNFQLGAGLGLIYYDTSFMDSFNVSDGGIKAFLTAQYIITQSLFIFTNVGVAPLEDQDSLHYSQEVTLTNPDGEACSGSLTGNCVATNTDDQALDFKSLGYLELGVGWLLTDSLYLSLAYRVFSEEGTVYRRTVESDGTYYPDGCGSSSIPNTCYSMEENMLTKQHLNHTISIRIGIAVNDLYWLVGYGD